MHKLVTALKGHGSRADFWSIYVLHEQHEEVSFRKGVQQPLFSSNDAGALLTVFTKGGLGYASTQDLSEEGIKKAFDRAFSWAEKFAQFSLLKSLSPQFAAHEGSYRSPNETPLSAVSLDDKLSLLSQADKNLLGHNLVIDSSATLWSIAARSSYHNSLGASIEQDINQLIPSLSVTANKGAVTQTRTLGGMRAYCRQGGKESLFSIDMPNHAERLVKEAIDLVHADNCPSGAMDVLIDPDQMMLQIHESIGHPLELDRILGDERNYAGTSFVKLDMFGNFQYGSPLLNVTFDPTIASEFASYGYDEEGSAAKKEYLIKDGILCRPLGGLIAQTRAGVPGVANARSSSWNRPPIDRMANLNLEAGASSFEDMLSSIDKGIYLKSNASWSIDDSRNKFQFGCEWGQLIEKGRLTKIVRNPNYRGISSSFWRNLKMVGDKNTFMVMGTPFCGKGEPNQCIRVGHASPICLFSNIDVFGGE